MGIFAHPPIAKMLTFNELQNTVLAAAFGLVLVVSLFKKEDKSSRDQVPPKKFAKGL